MKSNRRQDCFTCVLKVRLLSGFFGFRLTILHGWKERLTLRMLPFVVLWRRVSLTCTLGSCWYLLFLFMVLDEKSQQNIMKTSRPFCPNFGSKRAPERLQEIKSSRFHSFVPSSLIYHSFVKLWRKWLVCSFKRT